MAIHSSSIVSPEAEIAEGVDIGPFCIVKGKVKIGRGSRLLSHVIVGSESGIVEIGENNILYPHSVIGEAPQDLTYQGDATKLIIGNNNKIREGSNINIGTKKGGGITKIGNDNLIMSMVHIGHDCQIADNVVVASSSNIAGHAEINSHVKIGGMVAIAQFCRLGEHSYIAGVTAINKDVLPYTIAEGHWACMRAANKVGMDRSGFSKEDINNVVRAVRIITKGGHTMEEALSRIEEECGQGQAIQNLLSFAKASKKGLAI